MTTITCDQDALEHILERIEESFLPDIEIVEDDLMSEETFNELNNV
jgi:hypothetical protein